MEQQICAILLAAGYSSRMGAVKPVLPIGDQNALERLTESFIEAGIKDIYVVLGCHKEEILDKYFYKNDVHLIDNPRYEEGMFSSVQAGVSAIAQTFDAFLLTPADCPLISADTVCALIEEYQATKASVIYPVYQGKKGHPCLVSSRVYGDILKGNTTQGLKGILQAYDEEAKLVEVNDQGILLDMDTMQDYEQVLKLAKQSNPMVQQAIDTFLYLAPEADLSHHCRMVGKVAMILCKRLNEKGMDLNARLAYGSGLLHDIKKGEPQHDLAARDFLFDLGFAKIGSIAGSHMGRGIEKEKLTERELVFLADKLILQDKVVPLDVRFANAFNKYQNDEVQKQAVVNKLALAKDLQNRVESIIKVPIASFLQEECDNDHIH